MEVSARNQLAGKVKNIVLGGVMAEVTVDIGDGKEIVAAVTRASVERLGLTEGTEVVAIIKATEVLIGKP
jgi:molybdopterin-binding protein